MNYPKNIEEKLGFDQIRTLLKAECLSSLGAAFVDKISYSTNFDLIYKWIHQAGEFKNILTNDSPFPSDNYLNINDHLRHMEIEGFFLLEHQLHEIRLLAKTIQAILHYFSSRPGLYPNLQELLQHTQYRKDLVAIIERVLDDEGKMRNNASPELLRISSELDGSEREVRRKIQSIYKNAKNEGWVGETDISVRNGRIVLPILAEHKRKIRGFVHDESSTGQILFIEPVEILELNNRIKELYIERKREIERILRKTTDELRPWLPDLNTWSQKLALVDFIRAKASFSVKIQANLPELSKSPSMNLVRAMHPLLYLNHLATKEPVVPLNIRIDADQRIIVISGPNAGGKSVCLKTVGLLQYMLQCGLLVPADQYSQMGIFQGVFINIGDDQSIENNLSSYSSHLKSMKHFVNFATSKTLFLIDELGTGTDPQFGGPMGEAILETLNEIKAFGIVTTHFSNLKIFADKNPGLINASMAYDVARLQPLYRLEMGKPGSSFAFEVAQKIGLNRKVIERAREKTGKKQQDVDSLITKLEKEKMETELLQKSVGEKDVLLKKLIADYEELKNNLEQSKKRILNEAKTQAVAIIKNANQDIENTIKSIKEHNAEKEVTKNLRHKLNTEKQALEKGISKNETEASPAADAVHEFKEGDKVKIKGSDNTGEIIQLLKNKALVSIGEIKTVVALKDLESFKTKQAKKTVSRIIKGYDLVQKQTEFRSELDVRGKRGDEVLSEVMNFLDQALMLGYEHLRIIHGKGDGILRKLIRENLRDFSFIKSMRDEHVDLGGAGVTLIDLK